MTLALGIDTTAAAATGGAKRPPHGKSGHRGLLSNGGGGGGDLDGGGGASSSDADASASAAAAAASSADYGRQSILEIARSRTGWLVAFCAGLLLAALVVEQFEDVLEHHVELSFFVPLIMGHGGNTGSQAVTTVIRALALRQVHAQRDAWRVVLKEAGAGAMMGALLGLAILGFSFAWPGISPAVGAVVAVALPLVSLVANGLGALLTLTADRLRLDPAVTAVPFMTTLVDSLGLVIYFYLAQLMLGIAGDEAAGAGAGAGVGAGAGGGGGAGAAAGAATAASAAASAAASGAGGGGGGSGAGRAGRRMMLLASSAALLVGGRRR